MAPTRRHYLTASGLDRLAELEGMPLEELLFTRPVSRQRRRGLLERLDAVAVVYGLAGAIAQVFHPLAACPRKGQACWKRYDGVRPVWGAGDEQDVSALCS